MAEIKLDSDGMKELKSFYLEELSKTVRRLEHINTVLSELGEPVTEIELRGTSAKSKRVKPAPKRKYRKKRGPKSKWDKAIMKTIKQANKPLTYDEITDFLMISEGRSPDKRANMKSSVQNTIFRMRGDKKVSTFGMGSRTKYIAPIEWFDGNDTITAEYKSRVSAPAKSKKASAKPGPKRGPGRPRKTVAKASSVVAKKTVTKAKPSKPKAKAAKPTVKKKKATTKASVKPSAKAVAKKSEKPKAKKASPVKKKAAPKKTAAKKRAATKAKPKAAAKAKTVSKRKSAKVPNKPKAKVAMKKSVK